jgi:CRP/FNR family transcriptional regulator, cyclic AMP receptor protein
MSENNMGKMFRDGEVIVRQGEPGDCMFVIQSGRVEVVQHDHGEEFCLAVLESGDCFGEMALFGGEMRSADVRAVGEVWLLTLEKKSFLRRVHQDPTLAFRILEKMADRIRRLDEMVVRLAVEQVSERMVVDK